MMHRSIHDLLSRGLLGSWAVILLSSCNLMTEAHLVYDIQAYLSHVPGLAWLTPTTLIADLDEPTVSKQPQRLLRGQARQSIPLVNQWLYQLEDDSGRLWILTTSPPPSAGDPLEVEVQIHYETILIQGVDQGDIYGEELERRPISADELAR